MQNLGHPIYCGDTAHTPPPPVSEKAFYLFLKCLFRIEMYFVLNVHMVLGKHL